MWTALLAVMIKEIRQTVRDKRALALLLVAPIAQMLVLGYAVDLDVDQIPTVICDGDGSPASRDLAADLLAGSTFRKVAEVKEQDKASAMLESGQAAVAVIFAPGLARDLQRGNPVSVQVLVDGSDPNQAQIASSAASQFFTLRGMEMAIEKLHLLEGLRGVRMARPSVKLEPRVYYNPQLKSALFMVPGVAVIVLLVITTLVTAMGLAREREAGTMEQLMVTPIRPIVLLTGKCLPFALVGLVDITALLALGAYVFDVPIRGPLPVIYLGTLLYLMTTLGAGIFVSTLGRTQQQAVLGAFFFMLPAILLSGFMTPIDNMPDWAQAITWLNPCRYFVEIMREGLLKGAGFSELAPQLASLAGFGVLILGFSALRFRKTLN